MTYLILGTVLIGLGASAYAGYRYGARAKVTADKVVADVKAAAQEIKNL